ncbi:hypothetical protein OHA72_30855 [Dactylosporangium sp. NBC_01737]|uniref:hypothetical protein n=1 Tax=Dactylosporangium sp. NBC_01737 TaxID=2975959 RepID=UPI002E12D736|nr:hypothetical protein OHA72_30855 [Dactylosporangium sp. NBC_01737]
MSEYDGGELDPGYTGDDQPDTYGGDGGTDYGQIETGQQHESLDQLHQASGSEADYNNQFNVYEQDHAAAESTSFDQGHHVEYSNPSGEHYEESDFTSYDHSAAESDHVFAAEGSESSHQAEFSTLDALREQLDSAFTSITEGHTGGGAEGTEGSAGLGVASN